MNRAVATADLYELFLADETAWLEQMASLSSRGHSEMLDLEHLAEYLEDMARRDKREVVHRLTTLLTHLLKWEHQPEKRARSWELTIKEQREELQDLLTSGTLRNHAEQELESAYRKAVRRAAVEMDVAESEFPAHCPFGLAQVLSDASS